MRRPILFNVHFISVMWASHTAAWFNCKSLDAMGMLCGLRISSRVFDAMPLNTPVRWIKSMHGGGRANTANHWIFLLYQTVYVKSLGWVYTSNSQCYGIYTLKKHESRNGYFAGCCHTHSLCYVVNCQFKWNPMKFEYFDALSNISKSQRIVHWTQNPLISKRKCNYSCFRIYLTLLPFDPLYIST